MKKDFPELFEEPYARITKLDEEWMKSKDGKERWRKFIESYVCVAVSAARRTHRSCICV